MTFEEPNTKNQPLVSVIMNCLNCSKYVREAIDSVYAQTYKNWEIIFWDNASTDSSAEIAKSYDERLRYFRGDVTVPLYAARNLAMKQAKGRYIAFLDCDDMWMPQKLEKQVKIFEGNENLGFIYTDFEILQADGKIFGGYDRKSQPAGRIFRNMLMHYRICIQTVMISRKAIDSLAECFDDSLEIAGDTDLFLRLAYNWDVHYLQDVTAIYRLHNENISIKKASRLPVEIDYIIFKLSRLYSHFLSDYNREINSFRMRVVKGVIVSMWQTGKSPEARRLALQNMLNMGLFFFLYLASFIPYEVFIALKTKIAGMFRRK